MSEKTVTVRSVESVGPDTVAITLESPDSFDAKPGQFVQLLLDVDGEEHARHYTISSARVEETFEITVGIDPEGTVGPTLAELERGDEVRIKGPFGRNHYEGEEAVTLVVGGPGVGPAVGIAERVIQEGGDVAVVYRDDAHAHVDRLGSVADAGGSVFLVGGDLDPAVDAAVEAVGGQVFVYGFAEFLEDALDALDEAGADTDAAKIENFG